MKKNRVNLFLLIVVFSLPMLIAYQLAQHPQWMQKINPTNYGTWVKQSVNWTQQSEPKRPWQLVLWQNHSCDQACLAQLDLLARIRLAMGRKVYLLNIWLFLPERDKLTNGQLETLRRQDIHVAYASVKLESQWKQAFTTMPIVLFAPEHHALMKYPVNPEPKKMYHDFQLLIK